MRFARRGKADRPTVPGDSRRNLGRSSCRRPGGAFVRTSSWLVLHDGHWDRSPEEQHVVCVFDFSEIEENAHAAGTPSMAASGAELLLLYCRWEAASAPLVDSSWDPLAWAFVLLLAHRGKNHRKSIRPKMSMLAK